MFGKSLLWTAEQHGHGVQLMLRMLYAKWLTGATPRDLEAIRARCRRVSPR